MYTPLNTSKHPKYATTRRHYTAGTSYAFSTSPVLPTLSLKSLTWSNRMGTSLVHTGCSSRVASGASFPLSSALVLSSFSAKALRAFLSVVAPDSRPSLQDYCSSSFYPSRPFSPPFRCLPPPLYVKRKRNTGEKYAARDFPMFFLLVYDCISIAFTGFKGLLGRYFMLSRSTSAQELVNPL